MSMTSRATTALLLSALAALCLTFSSALCGQHAADSLLGALMSLDRLTWFYWAQDRLGNLIPAMAWVIRDPEWNMTAQVLIRTFSTNVGLLMLVLFLSPRRIVLKWLCALAVLLVAFNPIGRQAFWIEGQPYGPSLALVLLAWIAHRAAGGRPLPQAAGLHLAGLAVMATAYYVNQSLLLVTVPLWAGVLVLFRRRIDAVMLASALLGYWLAKVHVRWATAGGTSAKYGTLTPSLDSLWKSFDQLVAFFDMRIVGALVLAAAAAGLLSALTRPAEDREHLLRAAVMAASALAAAAVVSQIDWVRISLYSVRYFQVYVVMIAAAAVSVLVDVVADRLPAGRPKAVAGSLSAGLAAYLIASATFPLDLQCEFRDRVRFAGILKGIELSRENDARLYLGSYWYVWSAIYADRVRDRDVPVFGLAPRWEVLADRLHAAHPPGVDHAGVCFEKSAEICATYLAHGGFTLSPGFEPRTEAVLPDGTEVILLRFRRAG